MKITRTSYFFITVTKGLLGFVFVPTVFSKMYNIMEFEMFPQTPIGWAVFVGMTAIQFGIFFFILRSFKSDYARLYSSLNKE